MNGNERQDILSEIRNLSDSMRFPIIVIGKKVIVVSMKIRSGRLLAYENN